MQSAEAVLGIIRERGRRGLPLERLYRHLFNPELYLLAYGRIYRNAGAMTPGSTKETADGMRLSKIQAITEALRQERYRWTPVRRVYIEKKGQPKKKRPLGLPTWSDKLLQEVIRLLLEAYYEPQFSDRSHGFRPGRGCHTALQSISPGWRGTTWFIEGDITDCFGSLDHSIMRSILAEKIRDNRFLRLIDGLLQAGYLEDWRYHTTLSGCPQGGVVSPVMSNIYLDRLDKYCESNLLPAHNRGTQRRFNRPYMRLRDAARHQEKIGNRDQAKALWQQMQRLPSRDPLDPGFRRLRYCRYADDWLLGFTGPKREAEEMKADIGKFLRDELKLELSPSKTLITHGRTRPARFLGYEITVYHADNKHSQHGWRSINAQIGLKVPVHVARDKARPYLQRGKPIHRTERMTDSDFSIIAQYQAEYRGVVNYYQLAVNRHSFEWLKYVMQRSLTKTLAHKFRISVPEVYKRYRAVLATDRGPRAGLQVVIERDDGKKPLVAQWGGISLARRTMVRALDDQPPKVWSNQRSELVQRLLAETCELCGSQQDVEVHHVRHLKDLQKKGRAPKPAWAERMASRRRKTLIVCRSCHHAIHAGRPTRQQPRTAALESRVR
ncbi:MULTISPECIES: reverse transcriptase domain-containing protein [unclassified Streptomyces]|uniref:reverse transcriptase/maturase family protein n=1 Tax=unclassified Streptomyces TaxID=2593676 RepID=UPI003D8FD504